MNKFILAPIVVTAALVGCGKSGPTLKPKVEVRIENNSPDKAVKSWWLLRDLVAEESFERCQLESSQGAKSGASKFLPEITDGVALKRLTDKDRECVQSVLIREIKSVQVESETRAIVIANIKEATPIHAGVVPDESDVKRRADGYSYKYLLEKNSSGWKIAQIYEQAIYSANGDPWSPLFAENSKRYVPSMLFGPN